MVPPWRVRIVPFRLGSEAVREDPTKLPTNKAGTMLALDLKVITQSLSERTFTETEGEEAVRVCMDG